MKTIISTTKAPAAIGPYNQAIRTGNLIFASGQIPIDAATGKIVEGGIKEQTRQALLNVKAILEEAGLTMNNVVKTTVFMVSKNGQNMVSKNGQNMASKNGQNCENSSNEPEKCPETADENFARDFADMNSVYAEFFSQPYPARSAVAVKSLPKGVLVEIEVVAEA